MIDKELARETIALLGTASAMLTEDAHGQLLTKPADANQARALAATIERLGTDLIALGAAAGVLARELPDLPSTGH